MNVPSKMRVAAVQMVAEVGDVEHNLELAERLVEDAVRDGAQWVLLPEFFSTGVANLPKIGVRAPAVDGAPTQLLRDLARRHEVTVGGSTLVRDDDGEVRNAFLLSGPDGVLLGRHDKDLPTLWENALYIGGTDPGVLETPVGPVGVALCWELMRTQTVDRLAGRVDLVVGGSGWWSLPSWMDVAGAEARNRRRAEIAPSVFATYVGVPVVHAAHAGPVVCPLPGTRLTYRGRFQGGAQVCDATGAVLAFRAAEEGNGVVVADVEPGRRPRRRPSSRFWLQRRGVLPAFGWAYQNPLGRRSYRRTVSGSARPAARSLTP